MTTVTFDNNIHIKCYKTDEIIYDITRKDRYIDIPMNENDSKRDIRNNFRRILLLFERNEVKVPIFSLYFAKLYNKNLDNIYLCNIMKIHRASKVLGKQWRNYKNRCTRKYYRLKLYYIHEVPRIYDRKTLYKYLRIHSINRFRLIGYLLYALASLNKTGYYLLNGYKYNYNHRYAIIRCLSLLNGMKYLIQIQKK